MLAGRDRADLHRPPDPGLAELGELQGPQARHRRASQDLQRTEQAARKALDEWTSSDVGKDYPAIKRQWESAWEQLVAFFALTPEVRKVIYTTNMVESINYQRRRISKTRGHFPNDDALVKLLYLGCKERRTDTAVAKAEEDAPTTTASSRSTSSTSCSPVESTGLTPSTGHVLTQER